MRLITLQPGANPPIRATEPTRIVGTSEWWSSYIVPDFSQGLAANPALFGVITKEDVEIENVVLHGAMNTAVRVANGYRAKVTLRNCWIRYVGHWGIHGEGDWILDHCLVENIGNHVQWDHGTYPSDGSTVDFRHCIFRGCAGFALHLPGLVTGKVERCLVVGDGTGGKGLWCGLNEVKFIRNTIVGDRQAVGCSSRLDMTNLVGPIDLQGRARFVSLGCGLYWPTRDYGAGAYDWDVRMTTDYARKLWSGGYMYAYGSEFQPHFPGDPLPEA